MFQRVSKGHPRPVIPSAATASSPCPHCSPSPTLPWWSRRHGRSSGPRKPRHCSSSTSPETLGIAQLVPFPLFSWPWVPLKNHQPKKGCPHCNMVNWATKDFGPKAILPAAISDGGIPIWENQAVVGWRVASDKGEWLQGANRTTVGTATGRILNQWFREVVLWGRRHPAYTLFNLWDSTNAATRKSYMGDSVCHSFTEWSLSDLFRLGADFSIQRPLCRNYFAFITDRSPSRLDLTTPADSQSIVEFSDGGYLEIIFNSWVLDSNS